jgi:hypothetical protein
MLLFFFSFIFIVLGVAIKICDKMFHHPMSSFNAVSTQTPACNLKVTLIVFSIVHLFVNSTVKVNQVVLM